MGKVGGSIQWIDDPAMMAPRPDEVCFFFRQYGMIRKVSLQHLNNAPLGFPVCGSHKIDGAFVPDLFRLVPALTNKCSGCLRGIPCGAEKLCYLITHIVLRNSLAAMLPNGA